MRGFCLAPLQKTRDNALREYKFVRTLTNNRVGMAKIGYRLRVTDGRLYVRTDRPMDRETCQLRYYFK